LRSADGERTKKSGYSELQAGQSPSSLLWLDKAVGTPTAAKNADRVIFTQQTFNESPNDWVADKRLASPRRPRRRPSDRPAIGRRPRRSLR
jgi:hypothetical protein